MANKVLEAALMYWMLKNRYIHPSGKMDKAGRWYPSEEEWQKCCSSIRSPSRAYPWSLMTHCRTAEHVAHCFGVDAKEIKNCFKKQNLPALLGLDNRLDQYIMEKLKEVH